MTIVTKPLTEKKPSVDPLVVGGEKGKLDAEAASQDERYHYILRHRQRVSSATTLCLLITALLVMTVGLFGGLYIYRQMSGIRASGLRRGYCNVPYYPTEEKQGIYTSDSLVGRRKIDNDGLSYPFGDPVDPDTAAALASFFKEEFEIDDDDKYAKLEVPQFKNGRMGRFIHEFESNKTAIVDQSAGRCFIMPLDREKIPIPTSMMDMLQKMMQGHYSVNTENIRETMRVVQPPVQDLSEFGSYIQQECSDKTTYMLEKATGRIVKRSVKNSPMFTEFTGSNLLTYDIQNLDELP